jgi:hypothetical protein
MPPLRNLVTEPNVLEIGNPKGNVHLELVDIPIYKVAPLGSQVMDAIGQLVPALDRDGFARQPVEVTRCSLKDFCSHHRVSFDGRGDHISVENW